AAGKVSVTGIVSQSADVQRITQAFEQIPGVRSIATAIKVQPLHLQIRFYFRIGSADLAPPDRSSKLPQVKAWLDRYPNQSVQITGYSNPVNGAIENQWLALQRAKAVRDALVRQGVSSDRLQLAGLVQHPPASALDQPTWFGRSVEVKPLSRDQGVSQR
ncbi:MAG: OmpA family protein, partial [Leptolyngbyaceae cyanobacterium SM1_3_5]|nr:OmpA family protein [Leptolyngbyaceae cyanobacterium SM1_3_5]